MKNHRAMKQIKYILILLLSAALYSCELPDNINPKMSETVPSTAIFTMAEVQLVEQVNMV